MPYKNPEDRRAYVRKRYREDFEYKDKHSKRSAIYYQNNKERYAVAGRKRNRAIKIEAIQKYGGRCFCCGESIIEFLAIDHIEGNGNEQRRKIKLDGGVSFYHWLKRNGWPEGFQAACHNCNMGRHLNGGICPHQTKENQMSDYGKVHTKQLPGKLPTSAKPSPRADQMPGKSHETAIGIAEGLPIGSVHPAHTKKQVHQAKLNPAPHKASHAQRARVLAGNANTMGEAPAVTNQETGHGPLQSNLQDKKVRNKAFGYILRSEQGNANPTAMPDDSEV